MYKSAYLLFTFIFFFMASPCAAATSIGVVDVLHILTYSKAAKSIQTQREDLRETFLEEISKTEQALREEEKTLIEERNKLEQEAYAAKRQDYDAKLLEARKETQAKKRALEEASGHAMDVLREQLYLVVQSIANERGYELVISNKNVIAGEKSIDITEETMKRLNEAVAEIPLEIKTEE